MSKLWGGRFGEKTDERVHALNASLSFDVRMYEEDIDGSIAWAQGLGDAGLLTEDEVAAITDGLEQVRHEFREGSIVLEPDDEDIHTVVERRLVEIVGPVGGKLHTGRSRNDQVATDFRLWVMRALEEVMGHLAHLQQALLESAQEGLHVPMPGYTHLQHAQPVTWGHWILSHFWPLERDARRLANSRAAASVLPLGSAAVAGTPYSIDRERLAQRLGFVLVSPNSIDAVADRDFAVDFLYAASMLAIHLSRLAEQLILFCSEEFGFVTLNDAYSTGSSLMPQKKNPDTLELARGKSARVVGHLMSLLMLLKGLPSAYDKDLQEDKEPVFDTFDTLSNVLPVITGTIRTLQINPRRMAAQLEPGLLATDLADYLVRKGIPFREAHAIVGAVVRTAEEQNCAIDEVGLGALQEVSDAFEKDVFEVFDVERSLSSRSVTGGTSPEAVAAQLDMARARMIPR